MPSSAHHFWYLPDDGRLPAPMGSLIPEGDLHRVAKISFVPDADVQHIYEALHSGDHAALLAYACPMIYVQPRTARTQPAPEPAEPITQHAALHGGQGYTLQEQQAD
jgi:hypothetical protein